MIRRIRSAKYLGSPELLDIEIGHDGVIQAITPADKGSFGSGGSRESFTTAEEIYAGGRTVTSGLWDEHVHFGQWAQQASRIDLSDCVDAGQVLQLVSDAARTQAEVIAVRVRGSIWGRELTRERLDTASGTVPVVLIGLDLHSAWLNTAALQKYGFDTAGPSRVVEDECFALVRELDRISDAELDEAVHAAANAAAARGVVGVVDFEMRWGVADWLRREEAGFDALRVETSVYPQYLDRAIASGLSAGTVLGSTGLIQLGPLKVITDGSLGTHTAWCCEPYPSGDFGRSLVSSDELESLLLRADRAGISAAIHAIGDQAASQVLETFERTGIQGRIEHAQLLRSEDIARFARLGITASVQPEHLLDDRAAIAELWADRADRAFAFASLLSTGARLCFGSDAPVAPLDPWRAIAAAIHRASPGEESWRPEQRISLEQALQASMRGSLLPKVGEVADLVLLEEDPHDLSHRELVETQVAATLIAGKPSYLAPSLS
ncbi:amidohydrolase family protein [Leucobacter sp. UT-8R-CII-1-4]|uniref:amidohydrolase n=1 Tax=Leucobacter sp. UT-8R-CII-1-4 TaxID=3040075 RepID=UPI0024A8FF78|nr:amidohydrolase family protein [Leucobacter sp. UT-8R-CII-1-4]MDI6024372.1 amidohydrolase family protein [Leucobacter sp. UT-8R-CII-1-4]